MMSSQQSQAMGEQLRSPLMADLAPSNDAVAIVTVAQKWSRFVSDSFAFLLAHRHGLAILAGPLFALLLILFLRIQNEPSHVAAVPMLAVMAWVFTWWTTDAVPIAIASLVPLFMMPLLQIREAEQVARSYATDTTFLIVASFIMAAAVQRHGLHTRVILHVLLRVGPHPRRLLLAFMCSATFLSMLVDNAPAAAMAMPLALGLIQNLLSQQQQEQLPLWATGSSSKEDDKSELTTKSFGRALIYGITYSITMGGMATLTGNAANLVLPEMWQSLFPSADPVEYIQWLLFAFPLALAIVLFTWLFLCLRFCPSSAIETLSVSLRSMRLEESISALGPMPFAEKSIAAILLGYIVLLITKSGMGPFPGWGDLFNGYAQIGTITVLMATLFFVIPDCKEPGRKLLDWQSCSTISWSTVLLLGGGFALADGFESSGLTDIFTENLKALEKMPYVLVTPVIAIMVGVITEFTSNTSVATLFLPTVAELAIACNSHPLSFMVPAVIGSQLSFMLPVATAPNAIAYGTGEISIGEMAMVGIPVKLFGILLLSLLMPTLGLLIFNNKY